VSILKKAIRKKGFRQKKLKKKAWASVNKTTGGGKKSSGSKK
jgi:hypothetical protein